MKKNIIITIVVIVVIAIAWWLFSANRDTTLNSLEPDTDIRTLENGTTTTTTTTKPDVVVESAVLAAVGTYTGTGIATRSYDGATFKHTVTASIADPAAGKFYEGWLVMKTNSGPQLFSTGKLGKMGSAYVLNYTANKNYPSHTSVVVTEETESLGLDNNPEDHVLEGDF